MCLLLYDIFTHFANYITLRVLIFLYRTVLYSLETYNQNISLWINGNSLYMINKPEL